MIEKTLPLTLPCPLPEHPGVTTANPGGFEEVMVRKQIIGVLRSENVDRYMSILISIKLNAQTSFQSFPICTAVWGS